MRTLIISLLLLATGAVAAPLAAPLAPAGDPSSSLTQTVAEQRRPSGGTSANRGASDQTAGWDNGSAPAVTFPQATQPTRQNPVELKNSGYDGSQQYSCQGMIPSSGWPLYTDGLGNQNYMGGTCTFRSPDLRTGNCSQCGTYQYYALTGMSMPGPREYNAGEAIQSSSCYSYSYYTCNCDEDGNCGTCPTCGGAM